MKKLLGLNLSLLVLLAACSSSLDESKVLANYTGSKYYQSMKKLEQKKDKTEADYAQLVTDYHNLANESKNINVTNLMISKIKKIKKIYSNNPIIIAYYGSTYTMIGRDSSNPVKKISAVKEGVKFIDEAVDKDNKNLHLRILRAEQAISLPSFFNRTEIAIKDYQYLTENYEMKNISLKKNLISLIYLHYGNALKKVDKIKEAVAAWKKSKKTDPNSGFAKEAEKMLSVYDEA